MMLAGRIWKESMRTLRAALAAATILIASSAVIWKAEATMGTSVGNLSLANSYSPVEKVRHRYRRGYEYDHQWSPALWAVLRIPPSRLHVRDTRVSETLALSTLAAKYAVLSLS